jgi:hypothetical protein
MKKGMNPVARLGVVLKDKYGEPERGGVNGSR